MLPGTLLRAADRPAGSPIPLLLCCFAAATDFTDGRLARRRGPTRHGAVLDGVADVTFVLAGIGTGVGLGFVPLVAPLAIAAAFTAYVVAAVRGGVPGARSALGHAAGVCNYVLAGLVAGAVAFPYEGWRPLLEGAGVLVAGLNVAALLGRFRRVRAASPASVG